MPTTPTADLHSPDELLANATAMLTSGDRRLLRGAILEAITALEAFVHSTVFPALGRKVSFELAAWLEAKTRMDFESRLSVLVPCATGLPIEKSSALWSDYTKAKAIRNRVVHTGARVTLRDSEFVVETVRQWISYLGSTLELEAALRKLKSWVEGGNGAGITNETDANKLLADFFRREEGATAILDSAVEVAGRKRRADVILDFGSRRILIEGKFARLRNNLRNVLSDALFQVDELRKSTGIREACVVLFVPGIAVPLGDPVERHFNGDVLSVIVQLP
jgi:hypothetical protein